MNVSEEISPIKIVVPLGDLFTTSTTAPVPDESTSSKNTVPAARPLLKPPNKDSASPKKSEPTPSPSKFNFLLYYC